MRNKAEINFKKHSVSFHEAKSVFNDSLARISEDIGHSIKEIRYHIIGLSENNRIIITVFTERNEYIRIISARKALSRERKKYEEYKNKY
jgi:uncharacterized protein